MKLTLYSAHQSNKGRRKANCHDWSLRAQQFFLLSNASNGQNLVSYHAAMKLVKMLTVMSINRG
jgi:hypothetical protein